MSLKNTEKKIYNYKINGIGYTIYYFFFPSTLMFMSIF